MSWSYLSLTFNSKNSVYCSPHNWSTHSQGTEKICSTAIEIIVRCKRFSVSLHMKAKMTAYGNFISRLFDTILNHLFWYCPFVQNCNVFMSFTFFIERMSYILEWNFKISFHLSALIHLCSDKHQLLKMSFGAQPFEKINYSECLWIFKWFSYMAEVD